MTILISIFGILSLFLVALLLSENRKSINYRTVGGAFLLQCSIAGFTLYYPEGQRFLLGLSNGVTALINYSNVGISFLFGGLASDKMYEYFGGGGFIFVVKVLPIIVFFSALSAVLYYLGVMQWIVKIIGGALQKLLGTSKAESLSASANVFLGITEAPLLVKPYMPKMTRSELFAVFCGGLASIAGTMLAGYAQLGVRMEYLLAASFMAAPGGLLFAKIIMPEVEEIVEESVDENSDHVPPSNIIDAAATGAADGVSLAILVGAMLLAFVSLVALVNGLIGEVGGFIGIADLSLQTILGWILAPLAFIIGVPWNEAAIAGSFIGQKVVINEFFAYLNLASYLNGDVIVEATGMPMTEKTQAIISFALCGFANLGTVAIAIGGLSGLVPARRAEIAQFGMKALAAGVLSNLMAATLAGIFIAL